MKKLCFLVILFFTGMSFAAVHQDKNQIKTFELTIDCAHGIGVALKDLKSSNLSLTETQFNMRFGLISCALVEDNLYISFRSTMPAINGGAVNYFITTTTFEIIEKIGER